MRVSRIDIKRWRNFENVCFDIPPDTSLVCLVGENGSGKSNLLELVAGVAHRVGLSSGVDSLRGDPFILDHEVSVTLTLPKKPEDFFGPKWAAIQKQHEYWSGVVRFTSKKYGNIASAVWELGMKNAQFAAVNVRWSPSVGQRIG